MQFLQPTKNVSDDGWEEACVSSTAKSVDHGEYNHDYKVMRERPNKKHTEGRCDHTKEQNVNATEAICHVAQRDTTWY